MDIASPSCSQRLIIFGYVTGNYRIILIARDKSLRLSTHKLAWIAILGGIKW